MLARQLRGIAGTVLVVDNRCPSCCKTRARSWEDWGDSAIPLLKVLGVRPKLKEGNGLKEGPLRCVRTNVRRSGRMPAVVELGRVPVW